MSDKRDELISQIGGHIFYQGSPSKISRQHAEMLADFILAREKEQIAKLVEPLRKFKNEFGIHWYPNRMPSQKAIDQSLSIADEIVGKI